MRKQRVANQPTILVILGATGDLARKKIIPALYHLHRQNELPKFFRAVGFSRRAWQDAQFHKYVSAVLKKKINEPISKKAEKEFLRHFTYQSGNFGNFSVYRELGEKLAAIDDEWKVCANKLFYLSVPPEYYEGIFKDLRRSGLTAPCSDEDGWTRVLVEKPFGSDLKSAQRLDRLMAGLFREEQIYRIDHYLAKEMAQNILSFRFANSLFENSWSNDFIERIDIKLWEDIGVEARGEFYDGIGALRDVGQNHLLQLLAFIAMERPSEFSDIPIRRRRAQILKYLRKPSEAEVKKHTFRAQYQGYREIKGVKANSQTETYFKVRAFLDHPRWLGVPIYFESGKRLGEPLKEVVVTFKHPEPCLCSLQNRGHEKNRVVFSIQPEEGIKVGFWAKRPGLSYETEEKNLSFSLRAGSRNKTQYVEEYEKLLLDSMGGDQTLFVSTDEVDAMWAFVDPIVRGWQKNSTPLKNYKKDTNQISLTAKKMESLAKTGKRLSELRWLSSKKQIGVVGLGKMGSNLVRNLLERGWETVGWNRSPEIVRELEKEGMVGAASIKDLTEKLRAPKAVWVMVSASAKASAVVKALADRSADRPAGKPVDEVIFGKDGLINYLDKGDVVIDGGNSFYKDAITRFKKLKKRGINFIDVGVSGGPAGARNGATLMVGGERALYEKMEKLFSDLSLPGGYDYFGKSGAGHFVKMVHNGIEYGMMQAIAEGFDIMKNAPFKLNLHDIAAVYNHGSVIESRLVGWLKDAYQEFGDNLPGVSGRAGSSGEGEWTVKTAHKLGVSDKVIHEALKARELSQNRPGYQGRVISALRNRFGGHDLKQ